MTATTAATRPRRRPAPLRATVSQRIQLSPHLVRVTVTGPALAGFAYPGPASHFKLLLPTPGTSELTLPAPGDDGLVSFDPAAPLIVRTYTARAFRPRRTRSTSTCSCTATGRHRRGRPPRGRERRSR